MRKTSFRHALREVLAPFEKDGVVFQKSFS